MNDDYDLSKLVKKSGRKRKNSRAKGLTFERKIVKMLNERFQTEEFCRTPGSGAFATTHKLPKHLQVYGDIIGPKWFRFVIECKKGYPRENLASFLVKKSDLHAFIEQAWRDGIKANKDPLLIIQQDRQPILAITKYNEYDAPTGYEKVIFNGKQMCLFEDFLKHNDSFFISEEEKESPVDSEGPSQ